MRIEPIELDGILPATEDPVDAFRLPASALGPGPEPSYSLNRYAGPVKVDPETLRLIDDALQEEMKRLRSEIICQWWPTYKER